MTTKKNAGKSTAPKKAAGTSAKKEAKRAPSGANGKSSAPATKPAKKAASAAKPAAPKTAASKPAAKESAPPKEVAEVEESTLTPTTEAPPKPRTVSPETQQILDSESPNAQVAELGAALLDATSPKATNAARILAELGEVKLEAIVPVVDKFAKTIASKNKRVVQTAADSLPNIARVAPARVARHLELLRTSFPQSSPVGKDGLVRTFAALCTASVAYQKRLEPVLTFALGEADGKMLFRWSQIVLPALKGEPHARARAVVEARLDRIPRAYAQQIADFLGIKLRARYR